MLSPAPGRRPRHAGISPRSSPPINRRRARRVSRRARCAASAEITPCVYDERPRLPVGLAVGAADQAPRACDSAHGLSGKERAISRLVAPGSRVTSEPGPHNGIALGAIHSVRAVCLPASEGVGPRVRIRLAPAVSQANFVRRARKIRGSRAAVLEVRIHLPPAESRCEPEPGAAEIGSDEG